MLTIAVLTLLAVYLFTTSHGVSYPWAEGFYFVNDIPYPVIAPFFWVGLLVLSVAVDAVLLLSQPNEGK